MDFTDREITILVTIALFIVLGIIALFSKSSKKQTSENQISLKENQISQEENIQNAVFKEAEKQEKNKRLSTEQKELLRKHYEYEEQIHEYYKRRDEDPKIMEATITACENQIAIAADVAKIMTKGKRRYTLKSDDEIISDLKREMAEDLAIIKGTPEQKSILHSIDAMDKR